MYRKFFKLYIYHIYGIYIPYIPYYIYIYINIPTIALMPKFQGKETCTYTQTHTGHLAWWTSIKPTSWFCPLLPSQAILIHETGFELNKRTKSKRKVVPARVKSSDWQYGFLKCKLCILFVFYFFIVFFIVFFLLLTVTGDIFKSMVLENVKLRY